LRSSWKIQGNQRVGPIKLIELPDFRVKPAQHRRANRVAQLDDVQSVFGLNY